MAASTDPLRALPLRYRVLLALLPGHVREEHGRELSEDLSDGRHATTAQLGASLSEAVETFLRFRAPFIAELASTARKRGLDTREATGLLVDAETAFDKLLLAFMEGWQAG